MDKIMELAAAARERNAALLEKRNAKLLEPYKRRIAELEDEVRRLRSSGAKKPAAKKAKG